VALLVGLGGLLFGLIEGPHLGWSHPLIITVLAAGGAGLLTFVGIEARSSAPMIPFHLFRNRNFSGINLITVIHWVALSSVFFFLTLNLQQVQGFSATQAGLAILPISILIVSLSGLSGKLTDRIGPLPLLIGGLLITIGAFLLFMRPGVAANYWTTFFPATIAFGLGLASTIVPVTTTAMGALPSRYSGIASGLNNAAARIAQMLAVAIFGSVMLVSFRLSLADYTAALPLEPATRTTLLAEARNLGATIPPTGLSPQITQALDQAIKQAFVDSFRQVMMISIGLTLISLLIILTTIRYKPDQENDEEITFLGPTP
jgi:predicted MFS family arabinose efflux permease